MSIDLIFSWPGLLILSHLIVLLFKIEHCKPHDWQRSHRDVIELIDELLVKRLARES